MSVDLQTREGAAFVPGGYAKADLQKHKVWVCPLFEPFLNWLYRQTIGDITKLPTLVNFSQDETKGHSAFAGYRRDGDRRETCKNCHRPNPVGFSVPDAIWSKAVPDEFRDKVLCPMCFDEFATQRGVDWSGDVKFFPVSGVSGV